MHFTQKHLAYFILLTMAGVLVGTFFMLPLPTREYLWDLFKTLMVAFVLLSLYIWAASKVTG